MSAVVTFVIPVRHQDNARNWEHLKSDLRQTISSISAQTTRNWRAVVIANHGASLPDLPDGFEAVRVDFPPNPNHERGNLDMEQFHDAVRLDKGRRILAGMLHSRGSRYYMVVDNDDLVSRNIATFVASQREGNGWKVKQGYVWSEGSNLLFQHDNLNSVCGTSLIIRSDLYELPERFEDASAEYIKTMLGSHVKIAPLLASRGIPMTSLPFRGAIYKVGHMSSHSKSRSLLRFCLFNKRTLRQPKLFAKNLRKLQRLTPELRAEFFG